MISQSFKHPSNRNVHGKAKFIEPINRYYYSKENKRHCVIILVRLIFLSKFNTVEDLTDFFFFFFF